MLGVCLRCYVHTREARRQSDYLTVSTESCTLSAPAGPVGFVLSSASWQSLLLVVKLLLDCVDILTRHQLAARDYCSWPANMARFNIQ
ncbi:hypothetical protein ElyMa_002293400 [Elysia marginata]|uniref:Uncharacterized protein n=1 Tax=Elysia marginata TaxID=1093978 RepID=A0AAV4G3Q0_9GAST|nr:hypothetical protein ElyMa_002293400 [Elysia marginata]